MKRINAFIFAFVMIIGLAGCSSSIKVPKASSEYIGVNYDVVVSELEKLGFTDIETIEVQDLNSGSQLKDYSIGEISINGTTVFEEKSNFEKDSKVLITYHTIPKLKVPISDIEIQDYDCETIASQFRDAGFSAIETQEVYDLDPALTDVEFENEVIINGNHEFMAGDEIAFDSKISIICHRPFTRYTVKMNIDFVPNLLFNKYDIIVLVDDYEEELLTHGQDGVLEFSLKEGLHTFSFAKKDDYSICGGFDLEVNSEIESAYTISCGGSTVSVKENFVDRIGSLSDDEVKAMGTEDGFTLKNYKDVLNTLKDWGFTNIIEAPLYDIYWGWTESGEVESVTINGIDTYKRGDIFKKDAEVIITYHLGINDDPSKIKIPYDGDTSDGVNYEVVEKAFKDAGFTNVSTYPRIEADIWGYEEYTVANIYINGNTPSDKINTYSPDAEVRIDYYLISDGESKSSTELTSFYAKKAFEDYGSVVCPYGFKCHWFTDLINLEQYDDGTWFIKVGVTVENAYGNKIDTVAEGMVAGTDKLPFVVQFHVNL